MRARILKKRVALFCGAALLAGCAKQPAVSLSGQWELETISDTTGILAVGGAYVEEGFTGQKLDLVCNLE